MKKLGFYEFELYNTEDDNTIDIFVGIKMWDR